jgi:formylglycine-generating enzyme required for sulfatase activity
MGNNTSDFKGDNFPVENVSWDDVQLFIEKLNKKTGKKYRLPSEEEWFTACQAGNNTKYCGSNDIGEVAWYAHNSNDKTHAVGQFKANDWELYDMSGNVWEWTSSCYESDCTQHVLRGGALNSIPDGLRSAYHSSSDTHYYIFGFRLSKSS